MSSPIVNPEIPYNGSISEGLRPGVMCRIQGVTHPNADRFNINLQTGPNSSPRDDTALHISVRLQQGYIARNSYKDGGWEDEQGSGTLPIAPAQAFEIIILVEPNHYKIAVNGQHFCEFPHRIPFKDVSHLLINGDVSITLISWEAAAPPPAVSENVSQSSKFNTEGSQGPQQAGPPGGYGPPPPGYNPLGPYNPSQAGYGYGPPPPPGAQPESGVESFWEQAQSVLAGAIKSGAAEKLLSGLLSSGGQQQNPQGQGYAPQNAQYGIYPQLPQDENSQRQYNQKPPNQGRGPVESFFSNLLSGGGSGGGTHQQSYQQTPAPPSTGYQQTQQSQGTDFGSLLAGFLSPGNNQQGQNQYHGGPPQPVPINQQQNQQSQNTNPDDLSDILANLITGKNSQQQPQQQLPPPPQPPQQQQPSLPPQQPSLPPQQASLPPQQPLQPPQQSPLPQQPQQVPNQDGQSQQQYGQYPSLPQQQQQYQQQEQRGPIESLLSGLLSGGGGQQPHQGYQQQQPRVPQVGGEGSVGGLGSMGGILSNLAGQILHKPRDG